METKINEISINDIIKFIRKAMDAELSIITYKGDLENFFYDIIVGDKRIEFEIYKHSISIITFNKGFYSYEHKLSDREILKLEELWLDIESYRSKIAINTFNNFFNEEDKCNSINDLYDE